MEPEEALDLLIRSLTRVELEDFEQAIKNLEEWSPEGIQNIFRQVLHRRRKRLIMAVRVAVTGRSYSPGIYEVLEILGRDVTRERISTALDHMEQEESKCTSI